MWFLRFRLILTGVAHLWQCMMASVLLVALGQALLHCDRDGTAIHSCVWHPPLALDQTLLWVLKARPLTIKGPYFHSPSPTS